jgi:membrane fusion protein (multidrug efflux system)
MKNNNGKEIKLYKKKKVIIPAIILISTAIGFWFWYQAQLGHTTTDDAYVDGNRATISSKIPGRIDKLFINEGNNVRKGELIAVLDSVDIIANKKEVEAHLNLAKQNLKLARIKVEKAQGDFKRAEVQFKGGIIPKEMFDHALKALQEMKAMKDIAESNISAATAKLNVLNTKLDNTRIVSPINGVVAKRWVLNGDVIAPGQPIFSVYNMKNLWVTANLEETKFSNVNLNDYVTITVDGFPNQQFNGRVYQLGTNTASQFSLIPPNNASGNFTKVTQRIPIKISLHQVNNIKNFRRVKLLPGMSVEVDIKNRS